MRSDAGACRFGYGETSSSTRRRVSIMKVAAMQPMSAKIEKSQEHAADAVARQREADDQRTDGRGERAARSSPS